MPRASDAIFDANRQGRLGLILYAIPNFPNPEAYQATLENLGAHPSVSVLETTFPVADRYSEYANQTIRDAHQVAIRHGSGLSAIDHLRAFEKPKICVLYQATFEDEGFRAVLDSAKGNLDGLLFEWELETGEDFDTQAANRGIELIHCAGNYMTEAEVDETLAQLPPNPLIYFEAAAMTGAALADLEEMRAFAQLLKSKRPDVCLAAGFGVKTATDVAKLAMIAEMDAVIIGTAFLQAIADGAASARNYLDAIAPALQRGGAF